MIFFFQLWKVKTLHEARIFFKYTLIRTNASFMWIKMKMNKSVLQRGSMTIVPFYFMQNIF